MRHRIVLSYGDDEHLPIFTCIGANLKEKNVFLCESTKIIETENHTIVRKTIIKEKAMEVCYGSPPAQMFITYSETGFLRGFLYIKGKEYPILDYNVYCSMQIENWCYDNIAIIRLPNNFVEGNYF